MKLLMNARVVGSLFLGFGLAMLLFTFAGLRLVGMFPPLSFVIGTWLVSVGAYQIATNVTTTTPTESMPKWWLPGLAGVSVLALGGTLGLVVYASL